MAAGPAFVTIITPENTEKLRIPQAFVSQMQAMSRKVSLRDSYGKLWPTEVVEGRWQWYFEKGWVKFREDHSLEPGDIMVFEYKSKNLLDFKIFGETACKKNRIREEAEEEEDETEVDQEFDDGDENDDDEEEEEEEEEGVNYEEEVVILPKIKKTKPNPKSRTYDAAARRGSSLGAGAELHREQGHRRPKHPSFISTSRYESRNNALNIPKDVMTDYHITIPKKVILVDQEDREWGTKVRTWKDGRVWCTNGWVNLCNANNIKKNDSCLCELVQSPSILYIRVHRIDEE